MAAAPLVPGDEALARLIGSTRVIQVDKGAAVLRAGALLFIALPSVIGLSSPILLALSGILWQLWTLALAIGLWRRG